MLGSNKNIQQIGIDIGESSVKLVQLRRSGGSALVQNIAIEPLSRGLFVEGKILDAEQVGTVIRQAMKRYKFTAKQAVTCVNYTDIISRKLLVRSDLKNQDLESWIEFEVDKFVPFPVSELNIDYHFTEGTDREEEREVQIVACRRSTIDNLVSCLEFAGLDAIAVDVEHDALVRASQPVMKRMFGAGENSLIAIVDIGMSNIRGYILKGKQIVFQRDEPFGAGILIDDIAAEYSMSEEEAHLAVYNKQLPDDYRETILKPYVKLMLKELERAIQNLESVGNEGQIESVLLAGGSTRIGGIEGIVQKRVNREVKLLNPFPLIKASKNIVSGRMKSQGAQLATAFGLAMWAQN